MKRDMSLMRKILFKIEEEHTPGDGFLRGISIDGYDKTTVAEHCDLLYQAGLIKDYKTQWADNTIYSYAIGNLTNDGYEYLELTR